MQRPVRGEHELIQGKTCSSQYQHHLYTKPHSKNACVCVYLTLCPPPQVHSVPIKRPNSAKKPTKKVISLARRKRSVALTRRQAAQMKASDLLQEFRSALHDSMGLMEREVRAGP